ncbi:MAG: hypothetical protein WAO98_08135 [Alphaproteobacteria bacterium]
MSKKISKKTKLSNYTKGIDVTKERQKQNGGVSVEAIHERINDKTYTRRHRARFECALDGYLWYGKINQSEYEAGLKYRRAYLRYVMNVRVDDYGAGSHGSYDMALLTPIISQEILRDAASVLTKAQRKIVLHVCGDDFRAGNGDKIETLQRGLAVLAKHWNIL